MIYKLYSKYTVYIICYLQQGVGARSFADREINKKFKLFIFCIYFHSLFTSSNMLYLYIVTKIGGDASLSFLYERHCAACALLNSKIIITLYFLYMSQKLLLIIIRKIISSLWLLYLDAKASILFVFLPITVALTRCRVVFVAKLKYCRVPGWY